MAKALRPRFRIHDRVTLASYAPLIPAYGDKPFVARDTILRVSSIVGKGTARDPWSVNVTDDAGHFWHMQPDDIVPAEIEETQPRHATKKKSPTELEREIAEVLGAKPINRRKTVRHFSESKDKLGRVRYAVTYEDLTSHTITPEELASYREREARGAVPHKRRYR